MLGWIENPKLFSRVADFKEGKVKKKEEEEEEEETEAGPDVEFFYSTSAPIRVMSQLQGCFPFTKSKEGIVFSPFLSCYSLVVLLGAVAFRMWPLKLPSSRWIVSWILFIGDSGAVVAVAATVVCMLFTFRHVKTVHRALLSMSTYITHQQLCVLYRQQILLIAFGYLLVTSYLIALVYITPPMLVTTQAMLPLLIDYFLQMAMAMFRLQFFFVIAYLRMIIGNLCKDIASLTSQQTTRVPSMIILYERVCVIAETTMKGFGMALGVSVALVTVDSLISLYIATSQITSSVFSTWLLIELWQQWLLLTATEMHSWQCSRVPIAVHTAMNVIQDSPVNDQLRQFSVYLLHRRLRFTICGVVPLDYSLLFTIAGGVTTYMIVLLQFQQNESSVNQ